MTAIRERAARAAESMRRDDISKRYGLAGRGYLAVQDVRGSAVGRAAGGAALAYGGFAGSLAAKGFQGTVEQNRLDTEWTMLAREFAGAFKPVIEAMTQGVRYVRKFMQGLDGAGQNLVMVSGLLAGAYGAHRAIGFAGSVVGGLAGLAGGSVAGAAGGAGAIAGGSAAAVGGGELLAGGALAATAGRTGARGLLGRAVRFGKGNPYLIGAAVAAGTAAALGPNTPSDSNEFRSRHGENADELDKLGGSSDALLKKRAELMEGRSYATRFQSAIGGVFGYHGQEYDTLSEIDRRLTAQGFTPGTGRRSVTPDQFGYEEAGSAYQRASISYLRNAPSPELGPNGNPIASPEETKALFQKMADQLEQIKKNTDAKPESR